MKRIVCFHSDVDFGVTTHLGATEWQRLLDLHAHVEQVVLRVRVHGVWRVAYEV